MPYPEGDARFRDPLTVWVMHPRIGPAVPPGSDNAYAWALESVRVPVRWSDISPPGSQTSAETLLNLMKRLPMEATVRVCTALQMFLDNQPSTDRISERQQQAALITALFPAMLRDAALGFLRRDPYTTVVHAEQLLYVTYLALLWGSDDPSHQPEPATLAELLLRVNDWIDIPQVPGDQNSQISTLLRRSSALSQEEHRGVLARYYNLLATRARMSPVPDCDFDDAYLEAAGITIEKHLAVVSAFTASFLKIRSAADLARLGFDRIVQRVQDLMESDADAKTAGARVIAPPSWFRHKFGTPVLPEKGAFISYEAFHERPFVALPSGAILPVAPSLALQSLAVGVYWTLFTYYQAGGRRKLETFREGLGTLFQAYVSEALSCSPTDSRSRAVVPERDIEGAYRTSSCPDLVAADNGAWAVIEITVRAISMRTIVEGDVASFRREIREKFRTKMRQPAEGMRSFLSGRLHHAHLDVSAVSEVFPLLVTLQPFPLFPGVWSVLDEVQPGPAPLKHRDRTPLVVHPLQILSAEEIEIATAFLRTGVTMVELLRRKEQSDPGRNLTMKNYLFYSGQASGLKNDWMDVLLHNVREGAARAAPTTYRNER